MLKKSSIFAPSNLKRTPKCVLVLKNRIKFFDILEDKVVQGKKMYLSIRV